MKLFSKMFKKPENETPRQEESAAGPAAPQATGTAEAQEAGPLERLWRQWNSEEPVPEFNYQDFPGGPEGEQAKEMNRLLAIAAQDRLDEWRLMFPPESRSDSDEDPAGEAAEETSAGGSAEEPANEPTEEAPADGLAGESVPEPPEDDTGPEPEMAEPLPMDAQCIVYVPANEMSAWGVVLPPMNGGEDVTAAYVNEMLEVNRVSTGIETERISRLVQYRLYYCLVRLAEGTARQEGEDGRVVLRTGSAREERETGREEERSVDFRARSDIRNVDAGDVICDILPAREGSNGLTVRGNVLKCREVREALSPKGTNTEFNEERTQLTALIAGHVVREGDQIGVKPVLEIATDVDYSTGNLNFHGDIHIAGDVREDFTVRATGGIAVEGLVEAATLEADGDIVIAKGILGDTRAVIRGGGEVRAKYMERCEVHSGGNTVTECAIGAKLYSDNQIDVTAGRGTVVGGLLVAANQIKAAVIGSQSGRLTEIVLGASPKVHREMLDLEREITAMRVEQKEKSRQKIYLIGRKDQPGNSARLAQITARLEELAAREEELTTQRMKLESQGGDLSKCRLECGHLYPPVKLTIGPSMLNVDAEWVKCVATFDAEEGLIKLDG